MDRISPLSRPRCPLSLTNRQDLQTVTGPTGALDAGARRIGEVMKLAAAEAISSVVGDELSVDKTPTVAKAVADAAKTEGVTG